jgi:hypothetical protein
VNALLRYDRAQTNWNRLGASDAGNVMEEDSELKPDGKPASNEPDPECVKLANEISEIAHWVAGESTAEASVMFGLNLEAVREKLLSALQVLHGLPFDFEARTAQQRLRAVRLIHQTIDGMGCTDARSLLSEVNGRLFGHRPGWFMTELAWSPEQIALAQRVLDQWKGAKWDPVNDLLAIWDLRHTGKRRGGTRTSGASSALAQDYREYRKKIGA